MDADTERRSARRAAAARRLRSFPFSLLLTALVLFVLLDALLPASRPVRSVLGLAYVAVMLATTRRLSRSGLHFATLVILAVAVVVARVVEWAAPARQLVSAEAVLIASLTGGYLLAILWRVFAAGPVNHDRIMGAIAGYLLMGAFWAFLYTAVVVALPGSFHIAAGAADTGLLPSDGGFPSIYFSFVSLLTMGYGDIVPAIRLTQTMAWVEGAMGQIYLTVLVARLVALQVAASVSK